MNVRSSFTATVFYRWATATLVFLLGLPVSNAATESQENTPQPTSASVYANAIGDARFERSAIHVEQGYTIESGNLYTRDGGIGSLVVVRSPDGAVIARIDEPGKRGLLRVDTQGVGAFTAAATNESRASDTVETQEPMGRDTTISAEHRYIDLLMAYSDYALSKMLVDPLAFAFMQVEEVNLRLRNSLITGVSLRLAAVNMFDVPYATSAGGLSEWQKLLAPYRSMYKTDLNAAYSGWDGGTAGIAYRPGYTSALGWTSSGSNTFAHEVAHNVGGRHCWDQNGSDYNFGHDNGKTKTSLCYGDLAPYFSTPAVRDTHGLPLGNAQTADMARVWRENTARLMGYNPEMPGLRMLVVSGLHDQVSAYIRIPGIERLYMGGIVALSADVGPTELVPGTDEKFTMLRVKLLNAAGNEAVVKLRAIRAQEEGGWREHMNSQRFLGALGPFQGLEIQYDARDNAGLPTGYYNGLLKLEARRANSDWKQPINIVVSVKK
ncbi:hypothetical protein SAMN03159382_04375 [Pseudomonas sp. NFACC23-1]|uniref:reprolysin-like metallopeptidase n=1 Tax=unclassified Pseudomonas TaxID=196821 RepID=UPI00088843E0|nr:MULTISPECIES: hypothetical protein [unclassified Pseudomonas]SDB57073.1 hypothetical protein SAMN03159386_04395 [Pseudomonas sp. NFACC17-2]SEJ79015.1 hypothetical protein SAMN03159382_04375 [Pseudomonas sp. NFACC23-1]SFW89092.1 hypothetical protein SAMN05660640_04878 [Pseudomonas sp. NFACC16-2]